MEPPSKATIRLIYPKCTFFCDIRHSGEGIESYEDRKLSKTQMLRFAISKHIDEGHILSRKLPLASIPPAPWAMQPAVDSREGVLYPHAGTAGRTKHLPTTTVL